MPLALYTVICHVTELIYSSIFNWLDSIKRDVWETGFIKGFNVSMDLFWEYSEIHISSFFHILKNIFLKIKTVLYTVI